MKNGLVIYHYLQKRTTVDRPKIIEKIDPKTHYDAAFSVMQYGQTRAALEQLSEINAPVPVLVGNNLSCPETAEHLNEHTPEQEEKFEHGLEHGEKRSVLFGFSAVGGRREKGRVICIQKKAGLFDARLRTAEKSLKKSIAGSDKNDENGYKNRRNGLRNVRSTHKRRNPPKF